MSQNITAKRLNVLPKAVVLKIDPSSGVKKGLLLPGRVRYPFLDFQTSSENIFYRLTLPT